MSIYGASPERILFPNVDRLKAELESLEDRYAILQAFTLDLLSRHPEEQLTFMLYGPQNNQWDPQSRAAKARRMRSKIAEPIVYYIDRGDRIKIGTSRSIIGRMQALHAVPSDLLAIEPGGSELEHSRHMQFAEWRIPGSELFHKCDDLLDHIHQLVDKYPDPLYRACQLNNLAHPSAA